MLKQSLKQKLLQKLSPQQIQLMKLIQLPTVEFEQRIEKEIEENPALVEGKEIEEPIDEYEENETEIIDAQDIEVDDYLNDDEIPDYQLRSNNYSHDDKELDVPLSVTETFIQSLYKQLTHSQIKDEKVKIAEYIIGNIDEDGYLRRSLEEITDDLAFHLNLSTTVKELEELLVVVQSFDPPGVGARDLRECLLLQIKRKKITKNRNKAIQILETTFEEFAKKHYSKITQKLNLNDEELKSIILEIEKLNPKPGGIVENNKIIEHVIPDFIITINEGKLELHLNSKNVPDLYINNSYKEMFQDFSNNKKKASKQQKETILFVKQKIDSAKWFIEAIRQRQNTLRITMEAIMEIQKEYFMSGDEQKIKPMILKDIATKINMDISTISRVASKKYLTTPYGTILIKTLFSESIKNKEGEDISTKEIKNILNEVIKKEDKNKPLTDDQLSKILKRKGYPIARRTVAKYREQLHILVARLRKEL